MSRAITSSVFILSLAVSNLFAQVPEIRSNMGNIYHELAVRAAERFCSENDGEADPCTIGADNDIRVGVEPGTPLVNRGDAESFPWEQSVWVLQVIAHSSTMETKYLVWRVEEPQQYSLFDTQDEALQSSCWSQPYCPVFSRWLPY